MKYIYFKKITSFILNIIVILSICTPLTIQSLNQDNTPVGISLTTTEATEQLNFLGDKPFKNKISEKLNRVYLLYISNKEFIDSNNSLYEAYLKINNLPKKSTDYIEYPIEYLILFFESKLYLEKEPQLAFSLSNIPYTHPLGASEILLPISLQDLSKISPKEAAATISKWTPEQMMQVLLEINPDLRYKIFKELYYLRDNENYVIGIAAIANTAKSTNFDLNTFCKCLINLTINDIEECGPELVLKSYVFPTSSISNICLWIENPKLVKDILTEIKENTPEILNYDMPFLYEAPSIIKYNVAKVISEFIPNFKLVLIS